MATTEKLISSLIQQTKDGNLYWDYLSNLHKLEMIAASILEEFTEYDLDEDDVDSDLSFYTKYKTGFFILLNIKPEILLIALPTIDAHIRKPLNTDYEHQSELLRLTNLAVKQHPNVEDFVEDFINDFQS